MLNNPSPVDKSGLASPNALAIFINSIFAANSLKASTCSFKSIKTWNCFSIFVVDLLTLSVSKSSISFNSFLASLSSSDSLVNSNSINFNFSCATANSSDTLTPCLWKNNNSAISFCNSFFCKASSAVDKASCLCASVKSVFASLKRLELSAFSSSSLVKRFINFKYFSIAGRESFFKTTLNFSNSVLWFLVFCLLISTFLFKVLIISE